MTLTILALRPDLLNVNGDAENARVLAMRAHWAGLDARITSRVDELPSAVVIGSGYEGDLAAAIAAIAAQTEVLKACLDDGIPILCVAMGLEILGSRIEVAPGEWIDGLGLLDGESAIAPRRIQGDLVVDSPFGTLVGFESHDRSWHGADDSLGAVLVGHGRSNDRTASADHVPTDGARHGSLIGTHLRGPVLARNPALADHMLRRASRGRYSHPGHGAAAADALAAASREKIMSARRDHR